MPEKTEPTSKKKEGKKQDKKKKRANRTPVAINKKESIEIPAKGCCG